MCRDKRVDPGESFESYLNSIAEDEESRAQFSDQYIECSEPVTQDRARELMAECDGIEEIRGIVRIGYVSINDERHPEDEIQGPVIVMQDHPPDVPYYKVHIRVIETEPRYRHERK